MWKTVIQFLKAPVFQDDEVKTRQARALNALHLNMGSAMIVLGALGILFFFHEKIVTSSILVVGILTVAFGMFLNRRGKVLEGGITTLIFLWCITVFMTVLSGGIQSIDILFFVSGTVVAGILLGFRGALFYAGWSLLTGLGLIFLGRSGLETPRLFTFPPLAAWSILFINLVFTVVPLEVALQSLASSASRARASEERYRLITSVTSDYVFSIQYRPDGKIVTEWLDGAFETITGYTLEEYYARGGWPSLVHPEDREQDSQNMALLRANQKVITEIRIVRKNGEIRRVRYYVHPQWDSKKNQLKGIYGAVQDITVQKKAETELHQREAILEAVADAANSFLKISNWNTEKWESEIKKLLEKLGMIIHASHVYIFENNQSDDGAILMTIRQEWTAPGFNSDLGDPRYINKPLEDTYLTSWNIQLQRGDPFIGDANHLGLQDMASLNDLGLKALLDVPIMIDGMWWGLIGIDDMSNSREWSNAEVDALVAAANLLGATIRRQQLDITIKYELDYRQKLIAELEKKNDEAETLRKSTAIVTATLERSEAIGRILEQLERVLPYQTASVQLVDGNDLEIVSIRGYKAPSGDIGSRFTIDRNEPSYAVLRENAPYVLYEDVQLSLPSFNEIPHRDIRAWLAIPLTVKERVIGIIALDGQTPGQFSERDAKLAATYANQVAIALENARLFTELQAELSKRKSLIEELESKNAELERFSYTVSHDLRSPLVTIRGFLGYLERSASEGNMERFRKDLARISAATDRMDSLLRELLELSRIGRLMNQSVTVPFGDLVMDAVEIVHGRLEARNISLQIHPNLPSVYGDRARLTEVLQNLVDNAAKYMGDQQAPVIEIGTAGFDETNNPVFFVRDNGIGIAREYHDRIFRLFDKLDPISEGTGVGLALVKRIVELHGGRIWLESEPGKGTTFFFTLADRKGTS